jgi:hypothetical protein
LVSQGIEKLEAAISALSRLMGSKALVGMSDKVGQFLEDIRQGKHLEGLLKWTFGFEATQAQVAEMLQVDGLKVDALDEGSKALSELSVMFKQNMGIARSLAVGVTTAGTVLYWIPGIGTKATLLAASIDVLVLASIFLIGKDYTDHGDLLRRVRGIRDIAGEVQSA